MKSISRIQAKWDAQAAHQLRAELERLRVELEAAEARAERAEYEMALWMQTAENWRDDLMAEFARNEAQPGLKKDGHLVAI